MKIAILGKAGSGKSTLSDKLVNELQYKRLSFAGKMKEFVEAILMRPLDKSNPLDREFIQRFGTDLCRKRDPEVWIKHFALTYKETIQKQVDKRVVVDDCRFLNEAEFLRKEGFMFVKLTGRGYDMGDLGKHQSETELEQIVPDFTLDNSGDLEDTFEQLKLYMLVWIRAEQNRRGVH
jgi:hypothetical protein